MQLKVEFACLHSVRCEKFTLTLTHAKIIKDTSPSLSGHTASKLTACLDGLS